MKMYLTEKSQTFFFGEWVIIDAQLSGQVVDFLGDGLYTIDINGIWHNVYASRIKKDIKHYTLKEVWGHPDYAKEGLYAFKKGWCPNKP